jgi:hypothetical protein
MARTTDPGDQPPGNLPPLVDRVPTEQDGRILKAVAKALLSQSSDQLQTAAELLLRRAEYERQSADLWARLPEDEAEEPVPEEPPPVEPAPDPEPAPVEPGPGPGPETPPPKKP